MGSSSEKLRPGDMVEVRPWPEIRATLDENGLSEGLTFMPEILKERLKKENFDRWVDAIYDYKSSLGHEHRRFRCKE